MFGVLTCTNGHPGKDYALAIEPAAVGGAMGLPEGTVRSRNDRCGPH